MEQNKIKYVKYGGKIKVSDLKHFLNKSYDKKHDNHKDFVLDKELSGSRAQVYYNPKDNKTVVVHRGSKGAVDWLINDPALMLGVEGWTTRFKHAKDIQKKAEQKYNNSDFTTVGHSLGSKLAKDSASKGDRIGVNGASSFGDFINPDKEFTNVRSKRDVVSLLSRDNNINIKNKTNNIIKEHSYDILDDLNDDDEL